jgi:hypothetical protein
VSRINPTLRGFAIIVLIAVVITLLNFQNAVNSLLLIARIAFFLAIAFFLFLLWRERRSDIETWSTLSQRTFYGAIVLAVLDIAAVLGLRPAGLDAIVFFVVLACCGWAIFRVWRREHRYV